MAYPSTLRADAVALYDRLGSVHRVAAALAVDARTVRRWVALTGRTLAWGGDRQSAAFRARPGVA